MAPNHGTRMRQMDLLRALPLMEMPDREHRLLAFILIHGRNNGWTALSGSSILNNLSLQLGMPVFTVRRALTPLIQKRWVTTYHDLHDRERIQTGAVFEELAQKALDRKRVRTAIGFKGWADLNGDDALADELLNRARNMASDALNPPPTRERDRIKLAARELYHERKLVLIRAEQVLERKAKRVPRRRLSLVQTDPTLN